MKNNKGFTLIELLAVIIILAIIALIATPLIMNIINDSREGANKDSALNFGKAVELTITENMLNCPNQVATAVTTTGDVTTVTIENCTDSAGTDVTSLEVNLDGTPPDATALTIAADGTVEGNVTYGSVKYDVNSGKVVTDTP